MTFPLCTSFLTSRSDRWLMGKWLHGTHAPTPNSIVPLRVNVPLYRCYYQNRPFTSPSAVASGPWALAGIQSPASNHHLQRSATVPVWRPGSSTGGNTNHLHNMQYILCLKKILRMHGIVWSSRHMQSSCSAGHLKSNTSQRTIHSLRKCKHKAAADASFFPRKQQGGPKGDSWFPDDRPYIQLAVHLPRFTVQSSTWDAHGVNTHSCTLTSPIRPDRKLPQNNTPLGAHRVIFKRLKRACCPWKDLPKNM